MKFAYTARVTSEVCLLLLVWSLFVTSGGFLLVMAAFAAAVLVFGLLALHYDNAGVRALCCLPTALLLVLATRPADLIVLGVFWLFAALRFTLRRFSSEYWLCRRVFAFLAVLNVVVTFLIAGKAFHLQTPLPAVGFAVASILLGVYSLRVVRLGELQGGRWNAYSVLDLGVPLVGAVGVSALVWVFVQGAYYVLQWLVSLFRKPVAVTKPGAPTGPFIHPKISEPADIMGRAEDILEEELPNPPKKPLTEEVEAIRRLPPWVWLIILLVVAAIAAVLIILHLRKRRTEKKTRPEGEEDDLETGRRGRRKKSAGFSPDKRVRVAFRGYPSFLQQQGRVIRKSDTSQDVLDENVRAVSEEEKELRKLYLVARYGGGLLTEDDASRAEALVRTIRGEC